MAWPHIHASFRHKPAFSLSLPSKLNENFIAMQSNWSINTLFSQHEWDTSSCRDDDAIARRTTYKLIILSRSTDIRLIYMCINWVVKWITLFAPFPGHAVKRRRSCNRKIYWAGSENIFVLKLRQGARKTNSRENIYLDCEVISANLGTVYVCRA